VLTGAGPVAAGLADAAGVAGPRDALVAQPTVPSKKRASIGIRFILFHHDPRVRDHVVCRIDEHGVASRRTKTHEVAGRWLGFENALAGRPDCLRCAQISGQCREVLDVGASPILLGPHDEGGVESHACRSLHAHGTGTTVALLPCAARSRELAQGRMDPFVRRVPEKPMSRIASKLAHLRPEPQVLRWRVVCSLPS